MLVTEYPNLTVAEKHTVASETYYRAIPRTLAAAAQTVCAINPRALLHRFRLVFETTQRRAVIVKGSKANETTAI